MRSCWLGRYATTTATGNQLKFLQGNITLRQRRVSERERERKLGSSGMEKNALLGSKYCATRRCSSSRSKPRERERIRKSSPDVETNKYDRSTFPYFSFVPETGLCTPHMRDELPLSVCFSPSFSSFSFLVSFFFFFFGVHLNLIRATAALR